MCSLWHSLLVNHGEFHAVNPSSLQVFSQETDKWCNINRVQNNWTNSTGLAQQVPEWNITIDTHTWTNSCLWIHTWSEARSDTTTGSGFSRLQQPTMLSTCLHVASTPRYLPSFISLWSEEETWATRWLLCTTDLLRNLKMHKMQTTSDPVIWYLEAELKVFIINK